MNYFGEIVDNQVILNKLGNFANEEWLKTPGKRPDMNITLGEHIIMPNHIHGIIKIGNNIYNKIRNNNKRGRDAMHCVSTLQKFGPQCKNLASIIRGYKASVTTFARKNNLIFEWQPRYIDRIIDDKLGLMNCEQYICNNPSKYNEEFLYFDKYLGVPVMPITIIEIKSRCNDQDKIRNILKGEGAEFKGLDIQTDTYFRVPHGRLKLREGNIENNLIHYNRPNQDGPKQSSVLLYRSDPASNLKSILMRSLGVLAVVEKKREIYFIDNIKFHIDTVSGLGTFVEIEAIDEKGNIGKERLQEQCEAYLERFGVVKDDLVDCSYSDLILNK